MPMTPNALQLIIHQHIPLSQHMGFQITALTDTHIQVNAPLTHNINIHGTAFAGSLYSVATLTAWALVYSILHEEGLAATTTLVLGEGHIRYRKPIDTDLCCQAHIEQTEQQTFLVQRSKKGRSRLTVDVNINDSAFWSGKLTALT